MGFPPVVAEPRRMPAKAYRRSTANMNQTDTIEKEMQKV